ncbi:LptA/OstA family protein [Pararhodospirillum photometricum]|uniref:Organic solvent tolerance-like N-terminal domain-containing protein n=1 Tax=Pararhodospirillum photometricum DSM 122 TaxID=1150469 RepID=H6SR93_PARPM|nr:LptA/OstA family protein [Pararhodospirillum photometricum]CCG09815.1 Putative uncharacterized protein [Pararhodospirillum photometricum DSM 122]
MIRRSLGVPLRAPLLALGLMALASPGAAQSGLTGGNGPLEVTADQGIEWIRPEGVYIAKGNAVATQGDHKVEAQRLIARYHPKGEDRDDALGGEGGAEIYRLEAEGRVRITMPNQVITGEHAVRDLERRVTWVTGGPPRLVTPTQVVTARDSLEYWEDRSLAVARGHAVAEQTDTGRLLRADVLTALFHERAASGPASTGASGRATGRGGQAAAGQATGIRYMTASGNVEVVTQNEVIRGDEATYDPASGLATITGAVRITSAKGEQLTGSKATVNMKTGVSRLLSAPGSRARALFKGSEATPGSEGAEGQEKKR